MVQDLNGDKLSRAEFWQRIAAVSFGLWSLMIPLGIWVLSSSFGAAIKTSAEGTAENAVFRKNFELYVLIMEKRMTIVEERQSVVLRSLSELDARVDSLSSKHTLGNEHAKR